MAVVAMGQYAKQSTAVRTAWLQATMVQVRWQMM
jgi:hypothetical protein